MTVEHMTKFHNKNPSSQDGETESLTEDCDTQGRTPVRSAALEKKVTQLDQSLKSVQDAKTKLE